MGRFGRWFCFVSLTSHFQSWIFAAAAASSRVPQRLRLPPRAAAPAAKCAPHNSGRFPESPPGVAEPAKGPGDRATWSSERCALSATRSSDYRLPNTEYGLPNLLLTLALALTSSLSASTESAASAESADPIPRPHPVSRYEAIWENSPFELEAPPPDNTGPESPLADEFALAGITKVKGKTVVTLLDKKAGTSFDLREDQPKNSLRLLEVSFHRDPMLTEVKLARGAETGSIGYDKSSLSTAPKRPPQTLAAANGAPQQSVLNRTPQNPNAAPQVARRRILAPAVPSPQPPGGPTPGIAPQLTPPAIPGPAAGVARPVPTVDDRRQIIIPQPRTP